MVDCGLKKMQPAATKILEEPVIEGELLYVVKTGKTKKVPGRDGICLEFFKRTLEETKQDMLMVMNTMYIDGVITDKQKRGTIVCIPKTSHPTRLDEYRPLTLLKTDYKLLGRIIANSLRPWKLHYYRRANFVKYTRTRSLTQSPQCEMLWHTRQPRGIRCV
jgi:hypothetical protein